MAVVMSRLSSSSSWGILPGCIVELLARVLNRQSNLMLPWVLKDRHCRPFVGNIVGVEEVRHPILQRARFGMDVLENFPKRIRLSSMDLLHLSTPPVLEKILTISPVAGIFCPQSSLLP